MTVQELRIGNYLQDRKNNLCKVNKITSENFDARAVIGALTYLPVEGIPLTEEWLVKFGFEKLEKGYYQKGDFRLVYQYKGEAFFVMTFTTKPRIYFVHSLQNLYFCIEKKELI